MDGSDDNPRGGYRVKVLLNTPIHTTAHTSIFRVVRCHSRSGTRCDDTPCYSHNEHRSHCVLAGDTRLGHAPRSHCRCSVAHKPHCCHRRQAEHACTPQFEAQVSRDKPALPQFRQYGTARDLPIRGVTAATVGQEVRQPRRRHRQAQSSMHRDAGQLRRRARGRGSHCASLKEMC